MLDGGATWRSHECTMGSWRRFAAPRTPSVNICRSDGSCRLAKTKRNVPALSSTFRPTLTVIRSAGPRACVRRFAFRPRSTMESPVASSWSATRLLCSGMPSNALARRRLVGDSSVRWSCRDEFMNPRVCAGARTILEPLADSVKRWPFVLRNLAGQPSDPASENQAFLSECARSTSCGRPLAP